MSHIATKATAGLLLLATAGTARAEQEKAFRVRVLTFGGKAVAHARLRVQRSVQDDVDPMWPGAGAKTLEAWWRVTSAGADDSVIAKATTDADGWASFDQLPKGVFDVTAHRVGRAVRGAQVLSPPVRGAAPPTILLDAGHAISGRVVGKNGSGVAGALVVATYPAAGTARWETQERPLTSVTDQNGAFRIHGLPAGTAVLRACPPGTWFDRRHLVRVPQDAPLEIVLPLYALDAVVRDQKTRAPVAGATILFSTFGFHMSNTLVRGTTDAKGRLRLSVPNRWLGRGEIQAPGYLPGMRLGADMDNPPNLERLAGKTLLLEAVPARPVRGSVRDPTGLVAGTVVTATWLTGFETESDSARSGADGTFELRVREGLVHVGSERPGSLSKEGPDLDVLLATGRDGEQGIVRVPPAGREGLRLGLPAAMPFGRISGRVVTADGAPLAASVTLVGWRDRGGVRTSPAGTFELERVPPGEVQLEVRMVPRIRMTSRPVRVEANKTASGVQILVPSRSTARAIGRVVGPDGRAPKSPCYVVDWRSDRRHPVARDGKFSIATRPVTGEVEVEIVNQDGWGAIAKTEGGKDGSAQFGTIVLQSPSFAAFRVVAKGGDPVAKATATLFFQPDAIACGAFESATDLRSWRADAAGQFRVPIPRRGDWEIRIRAPGSCGLDVSVYAKTVVLRPFATFAGRVRFANGQPAVGVRVEASPLADSHAPYFRRDTVTDAAGRFRLERLAAVAHDLDVESGAAGSSIAPLRMPRIVPNKPLDLVVRAAATIEGRVVDVRGRAVADAEVEAEKEDDEYAPTLMTKTDARGAFRLAGAGLGKYDLHVRRDDPWTVGRVAGVASGMKDLVVQADCGHQIAGRVVDAAGRPRAGWVVFARHKRHQGEQRRARTGAAGRFVLDDLDGGVWELTLGRWGHRKPRSGGNAVPASTTGVVLVVK